MIWWHTVAIVILSIFCNIWTDSKNSDYSEVIFFIIKLPLTQETERKCVADKKYILNISFLTRFWKQIIIQVFNVNAILKVKIWWKMHW